MMVLIQALALFACITVWETTVIADEITNSREGKFVLPITRYWNTVCSGTSNGQQLQGTCLDRKQCYLAGGTSMGSCGVLGACCLFERSCYTTTHQRLSYFVNPPVVQQHCTYQVDVMSRDVCQIRLDFDEFRIAPPTLRTREPLQTTPYYCINDSFTVTSPLSGQRGLGFSSLCGRNDGQHIYIPVNASQGASSVSLSFNLADRNSTSGSSLPTPTWRIRITQLECPGSPYDYSTFTAAVASLAQQHLQKFSPPYVDFHLLAPPGCLQYYTERRGTYMSFNYNTPGSPDSQYIAEMHYAICFRRTADACGIQHTAETFNMGGYNTSSTMTDDACNDFDYLFVPDGRWQGTARADKFCGDSLLGETVTSISPGPFYVVFNSDSQLDIINSESGFRIDYQVLGTCE
ncbi:uncharacterized protein LOC126336612 [Schistocerca gregaria]|uniref:uncharacterized protein LOC126336612 n=1 Tax=Schistocerca gregaria TaxID=7010 RepID=UPI00211F2085|nr:uncharacterized protein LOC126336612 [Schistocerca gregaria]XP_049856439.1 uncharacterized protein LOC126336612 [Schistocerca gregaria]